jgi:hypothetical protein
LYVVVVVVVGSLHEDVEVVTVVGSLQEEVLVTVVGSLHDDEDVVVELVVVLELLPPWSAR